MLKMIEIDTNLLYICVVVMEGAEFIHVGKSLTRTFWLGLRQVSNPFAEIKVSQLRITKS